MVLTFFTDEQSRVLVNLEQHYAVWMSAEQALAALPYDLRRKEIGGRSYLYEINDRSGNGKSQGRWTPELDARFATYHATKKALIARRDASRASLVETCQIYRGLRLPLLSTAAGKLLREGDRQGLLGSHFYVVGTNTIPAYAIEANAFIRDAPDETMDFDIAWTADEAPVHRDMLWTMLKAVDATYTVNSERNFQARNADAYEIEVLIAPSKADSFGATDKPRPVPLPEQEWLLNGRPVDHIVVCRDGAPARIVAPDPRWFALHKLWMAAQAKRNPLKRDKDRKQGTALLSAIASAMPQYRLNDTFEQELPAELHPFYQAWAVDRPPSVPPSW